MSKKRCYKCVYRRKNVKQSKNETNTRMLIFYSKNNKKLRKYLTLARASKINTYTKKKTYYQTAGQTRKSKLKYIAAFLARYHSSSVFFANEMKLFVLNQIPTSLTHNTHTINNYNKKGKES